MTFSAMICTSLHGAVTWILFSYELGGEEMEGVVSLMSGLISLALTVLLLVSLWKVFVKAANLAGRLLSRSITTIACLI